MRADLFLVEHGFATTRSQAQRLIAAGVQWRVLVDTEVNAPWKRVQKNGDEVPEAAEMVLLDTAEVKYISRGGLKLEGALKATGLSVAGARCLDIGQSTGGFTDCLLQHGASEVVGVDVGQGQLHPSMRSDPRVLCIEGVNARSLTLDDLAEHYRRAVCVRDGIPMDSFADDAYAYDDSDEGDEEDVAAPKARADKHAPAQADAAPALERFDFLTADLSFISLALVLPAVARLLKADGHLLMLVKPQFELQPGQIGKGGIVRDPALFDFVEQRIKTTCNERGLDVLNWLESPIAGGDGNREFFIYAKKRHDVPGEDEPLAAAPGRSGPKRTPRSEIRALHAAHEDSEEAHAGQHGPARAKRRTKPE